MTSQRFWLALGLVLVSGPAAAAAQDAVPPSSTGRAAEERNLQQQIYWARDRVLPALVNVQPVVRDFSSGQKEKQRVTGSGVLIRDDGYVVTNYHVAGQSEDVLCTLWNKERVRARLVGGDPLTDLAVLQLDYAAYEGERPRAAVLGNSSRLQTGEMVMALGSPFALSRSLSFGVVSTTDRFLSPDFRLPSGEKTGFFNTWIQTDAAINPGNSGGPLVNLAGEVVGINTRAFALANNLGFSIPAEVVRGVVEAIIGQGRVERSWIGVEVQPLQELEDVFAAESGQGVLVSDVEPDSPAMQAGLRAGDLLLEVEGEKVSARFYEEIPAFYSLVAHMPVGREIDVTFAREGVRQTARMTTQEYGRPSGIDFEVREWGFAVRSITKQMALDRRLPDTSGVLVGGVKSGGAAEQAGLLPNDVIRSVGETPVETLEAFRKCYEALVEEKKDRVMLSVKRRDSSRFVLLKPKLES